MTVKFTAEDLKVFNIPGFKERMAALKSQIRPKLETLGEELGPLLMNAFKQEFFPHTAKHLRRTVNPPDETWVALGPQSRGYKATIYFAFCIGKSGTQARVVMKDESSTRPALGDNLISNRNFFTRHAADFKGLSDYTRRDKEYAPQKIAALEPFLTEAGQRLKDLKSALFDVGVELKPLNANLAQEVLKAFDRLYPFYECGLKKGVKFR